MQKRTRSDLDKACSIADTIKKDCASMDISSLDPDAVINITTHVSESVSHLEKTVDNIVQQFALGRSMDGLDPSTLNQVVDTGRFLHKVLGVVRQVWKQRHVTGKLETTVGYLQKKLDGVLQTVVESLGENGKNLEEKCLKDGIKLKTLKIADDYDVKFCKKEDLNPFHTRTDKHRDMQVVFKEFDIIGTLSVEGVPHTKREIPDNLAFVSEWPDASPFTSNKPDSHGLKLETDRDHLAEIRKIKELPQERKHDGSDDHEDAIIIPSKYIDIAVGDSKDVKSATGRKVKITLTEQQKKQMRQLCKQKLLSLGLVDEVGNTAEYKNPEDLPFVKQEKLKYLLLARILKEHQSHAVNILTQFNDTTGKHAANLLDRQNFKFVFLVDNSGSMNGEKMTLALNILIVFLEAMKRLEYQTCVVRFGGEESQRVLKTFEQDLDNQIGQYIIEAFDASEKTLAADAMKFVAREIFNTDINPNEHRFVVLITDGIWSQQSKDAYGTYQNDAKARMIVLTTNPHINEDLEFYKLSVNRAKDILDNIAPGAWESIDPQNDLVDQIIKIAHRLNKNICDDLSAVIAESKKAASKQFTFSPLKWAEPLTGLQGNEAGLKYKSNADIEWGKSIYASDLYRDLGADDMDEDLITDFTKLFEEVSHELDAYEVDIAENAVITKCSMKINTEEESFQTLITDLDTVLDTLVLPNNRPTRPLQDYHGPTFSLKGFIRFICTDGQYKKIYENMIGHPRKDYQVSVILDTSASMAGMTAIGAIQGFLGLAAALHACSVRFNLLTAGAETLIIKGFQQEWDAVAKARAYNAITFKDRSSNISDAVLYATQLIISDSAAKAKKYIFVLTDGFDSTPGRLKTSLAYAESNDIMVTGIGIGYFTGGVFSNFPNYVVVNNPKLLPDGLRKLFMAEGRNEVPPDQFIEKEKTVKTSEGKSMTNIDQIWNEEMGKVFSEQVERSKNALYLATNPIRTSCNSFGIDLCFVLDTTGSMGSYIEMAKKYITEMTQKVRESVRKYSGKLTDLRVAFIGYKDFGDAGHTQEQPFTEHIDSVTALVSKMSPSGGGDTPEDKIRALKSALNYSWEHRAKFLVLIADAPGHGTWCTGGKFGDSHPDKGGDMPGTVENIAQKEIHLMYVQITNMTDYEFHNFRSTYTTAAPPSMKNGFIPLDIRSGGGADILQSKITDEIDGVIDNEFM
ncbi:uncharacterized protein LOC135491619 [Lineus longissimus]|uniref:uncharacterized protein LOC135491619 n=1 Tax=Lineus longissimus TaxID=88925 RepID=UPI00315DC213